MIAKIKHFHRYIAKLASLAIDVANAHMILLFYILLLKLLKLNIPPILI